MNPQARPSPSRPTATIWFIGVLLLLLALFYVSLIGDEAFQQLRQWPTLHQERDFPSYYLAGQRILQGEDFYSGLQEEAQAAGFEDYFIDTAVTPPTFNLVIAPLALLSYPAAWGVWQILSLLALFAAVPLIVRELNLSLSPPGWLILGCAVLLFPPLSFHMLYAHSELFLLLLLASAWMLLRRGQEVPAGVLLGLAGALRLYPLFLLLYLVQRRAWKALLAALVSGLGLAALAAAVTGPASYLRFLDVLRETTSTLYPRQWNLSLWGDVHKLAAIWPALGEHPGLRDALAMLLSLGILGLTLWLTRRPGPTPHTLDLEYGLFVTAMLLASPLSWIYYQVLLYLPLLVLFKALQKRGRQPAPFFIIILALLFAVTPLFGGRPDMSPTLQRLLAFAPTMTPLGVYLALQLARQDPDLRAARPGPRTPGRGPTA